MNRKAAAAVVASAAVAAGGVAVASRSEDRKPGQGFEYLVTQPQTPERTPEQQRLVPMSPLEPQKP